jgi:adenosylcobyric acid synthase
MGVTAGPDTAHPFGMVSGKPEGATNDGVNGTYLHGIFSSDAFRHAFLNSIADPSLNYEAGVEAALDGLAAHLERHLDLDALLALAADI